MKHKLSELQFKMPVDTEADPYEIKELPFRVCMHGEWLALILSLLKVDMHRVWIGLSGEGGMGEGGGSGGRVNGEVKRK